MNRAERRSTRKAAGRGAEHQGATDVRQSARSQSERERSGQAAGASGGRSYAFRRS